MKPSSPCVTALFRCTRLLGWIFASGLLTLQPVAGQSSSSDSARVEPAGPSSRRSPLTITEIMYHPPRRADSNDLEFVEIYNSQPWPEEVSGYRLAGAVDYLIPAGRWIPAEGVLVLAFDPTAVRAVHGITNVLGPYSGRLPNNNGELRLLNPANAVLCEVAYDTEPPWPVAADGAGHSLVLARPSWGERHPAAWSASDRVGGSPGRLESVGSEPLRDVMINELLTHTTAPEPDFLELYNHSITPADLSGCHLTDDAATNKYTFAGGVTLAPRGFLALNESQLGFALSAAGETLYLLNSAGTRVLDAVRFGAQSRGGSVGRWPDGSAQWRALAAATPALPNSAAASPDVVINEIFYAPLSWEADDEFVELHNRGSQSVDLSGWRFAAGINFVFPPGRAIAAGGYLVVAANVTQLLAQHPSLTSANVIGDFGGRLAGRGERLALARPELVLTTNQGQLITNVHSIVVDEVTYDKGGRWPAWADHGGSSLERIDARADGHPADNWADSDESAKAAWTIVEATGRLDLGDGSAANSLQVFLLGAGECLLDDVEVISATGVNVLANANFDTGLTPWTPQGDHDTSFLQSNGGINNSRCLHVRAGGDGDPGANRIRVPLTTSLPLNTNATIRAKVRWLRGHPEILLRLGGNYLEAYGRMVVPGNLGTPGARNSRALENSGPAIYDVRHEPVLPAANAAIRVMARLSDPDGIADATVRYRIDPDTNTVVAVPLLDDGTGGDAVAGDGLFTATIPGQPAGRLVAFHVHATDNHTFRNSRTFPNDAPERECLVRSGETEPNARFGTYRLWFTQATLNRWTSRFKLSNAGLDATFVYGHSRVIYNVGALYAGSAYHASRYTTPTGVACDYRLLFPVDDPFLGSDEATLVWPGLTGGDPVDGTALREPTCYWLAAKLGLPFNYQRPVHFYVNGVHRSFIMQDIQKPDGDLVEQWFPDDADGDLFKIQIWREYDAAINNTTQIGATLGNFTTTGGLKKTARYRWCWTPRGSGPTRNHFDDLFALVDVVNGPSDVYTAAVEGTLDIEQWLRTFAVEHIVGNWDSYGYGNGQNMYAYKPGGDRWKLMMWDIDVCLGNASDPATADVFKLTNPFFPSFNGDPAVVDRMYRHPGFARHYWRALQEAVDGPLASSNLNAFLDARYAAFTAGGVAAGSPDTIKTFLSQRRTYLIGRLATVAAPFAVTTPVSIVTSSNLVLLSGTAPIAMDRLTINGIVFPVTWTSVTSWTARVVMAPGETQLVTQGLDRAGHPLAGARSTNTVQYIGPALLPEDWVAINEIMYRPAGPGAAYVELFNSATNFAFDLGQWRLNGLDYTFPPGTILEGKQFLVLAEDRGAFVTTHGIGIPVFAEYPGRLQTNGETLTLFRPGLTPDDEVVVDRVKYESAAPWPAGASGQGASLQLIDPRQDHARVSNWSGEPGDGLGAPFTPGAPNSGARSLPPYPAIWLNEVQPVNLTGPNDAAGHRVPWIELHLASVTTLDLSGYYLADNYTNLTAWAFPAGATIADVEFKTIWADGAPGETTATEWHTSFRLNALTGSVALVRWINNAPQIVDYVNYRDVAADQSVGALPDGQPFVRRTLFTATPGRSNRGAIPAVTVFINEWLAQNVDPGGFPNPAGGNYDDWFELYNPGPDLADLSGFFLTDDLASPFQFMIPAGYRIPPRGYLVVWADGDPSRNGTNSADLHLNFQLARSGEQIGLFAPDGQPIDSVTFGIQTGNVSEGRYPDGDSSVHFLATPTPGLPNTLDGTSLAPAFTGIERLPDGNVALEWRTRIGRTYQIEYKDNLNSMSWILLGEFTAGSASLSVVDPLGAVTQRFYRVREME